MYWDFCLPSFWQTCHFTNRYPKQKGGHFWGVLTYCCMLRLLQMQLSQALFKGSHATMQTTQRRYQCATALRPFLEGRKSNSMKNESPYLQDGHLMSTLKDCGDIGWDLFRYLQLSVELCWHHKWATELADILRFMYLLTWLKIHLMVNSIPSLSHFGIKS